MRGRLLNDRATRGKITLQNSDTTLRINGVLGCLDDVLFKARACGLDFFADCAASDGQGIEVKQWLELTQQRGHAACVVEVFHVMLTRGLQIK